ncbi:pitrilysin family protein [Lentzea sp. NPDC006480]|uniref:pitrilysin family protein n=1 Tax=Lentzea sp. NPDC006480 TaxID=3157176 RepID=UPI0033BE6734
MFEVRALPNGTTLMLDGTLGVRSVTVCVALHVGSRDERADENGLTHMLEHVVMSGPSADGPSVSKWADTVGGQTNASTFLDLVVFWARVPPEHGAECAARLASAVSDPLWTDELCASERLVVLQELLSGAADPVDVVNAGFYRALFDGHPLGRPVGGSAEHLPEFTADRLLEAHQEWVTSADLTVTVVGPAELFDELTALLAASPLGTVERKPSPPDRTRPPTAHRPAGDTPLADPEAEYAYVAIGGRGADHDDELWGAFQLLTAAIGGTPGSMLYDAVRGERGLSYQFQSVHSAYSDCGVWRVVAGAEPAAVTEVGRIVRACLETVAAGEIDEHVITAARRQALGSVLLDNEDPVALAFLDTFFASDAAKGAPVELSHRLIAAATGEQLARAARRVLDTWTCVVAPPARDHRTALVRGGLLDDVADTLVAQGHTAAIGPHVVVISPETEALTGEQRALVSFGAEHVGLAELRREIAARHPEATSGVLKLPAHSPAAPELVPHMRYLRAGDPGEPAAEPGWTVLPMAEQDAEDVRKLLCEALRVGYRQHADERLIGDHVDAVLAGEDTTVFVARENGVFAGHATLVPDEDELTGERRWEMLDMFVLEPWRGSPASRLLSAAAAAHAHTTGLPLYGHVSGSGEEADLVHARLAAGGWAPAFGYWVLPLEGAR